MDFTDITCRCSSALYSQSSKFVIDIKLPKSFLPQVPVLQEYHSSAKVILHIDRLASWQLLPCAIPLSVIFILVGIEVKWRLLLIIGRKHKCQVSTVIIYIIGIGCLIDGADGTLENYVARDVLELVALIAVFVSGLGNVEPTLRIIPLVLQLSLHGYTVVFAVQRIFRGVYEIVFLYGMASPLSSNSLHCVYSIEWASIIYC